MPMLLSLKLSYLLEFSYYIPLVFLLDSWNLYYSGKIAPTWMNFSLKMKDDKETDKIYN